MRQVRWESREGRLTGRDGVCGDKLALLALDNVRAGTVNDTDDTL